MGARKGTLLTFEAGGSRGDHPPCCFLNLGDPPGYLGGREGGMQRILSDIFFSQPSWCILPQWFARVVEWVGWVRERQMASGRQIEGLCEGLMQRAFAGELVA